MFGYFLILVFLTVEVIFGSQGVPSFPLLSKPVGVGQPRSWGKMLSDPLSSRINHENHLGEVSQEKVTSQSNNENVLELLQTLRKNISSLDFNNHGNSEVTSVQKKKRKTDALYDVFDEVYKDYEDDKQAAWTSVGHGRVKIWPLSFGMR